MEAQLVSVVSLWSLSPLLFGLLQATELWNRLHHLCAPPKMLYSLIAACFLLPAQRIGHVEEAFTQLWYQKHCSGVFFFLLASHGRSIKSLLILISKKLHWNFELLYSWIASLLLALSFCLSNPVYAPVHLTRLEENALTSKISVVGISMDSVPP